MKINAKSRVLTTAYTNLYCLFNNENKDGGYEPEHS